MAEGTSSLPATLKGAQASILSFFKPKAPSYVAPPSAASKGDIKVPSTTTTELSSRSPSPPAGGTSSPATSSEAVNNKIPLAASASLSSATSSSKASKSIPDAAVISRFEPGHLKPFERINTLLLPMTYSPSFYSLIVTPSHTQQPEYSRAILWRTTPSTSAIVVGGIVCRIETPTSEEDADGAAALYIQSLALLSPYKSYGLATAALDDVIATVIEKQNEINVSSIYAHVWTQNEDGLAWYLKRGFVKEETLVENYYPKLKPSTAWILRRAITPSDHLRLAASTAPPPVANESEKKRPPPATGTSFQTRRPDMEWNDLPTDILLPSASGRNTPRDSAGVSGASSRSSSTAPGLPVDSLTSAGRVAGAAAKKKKRAYPQAAFAGSGSQA